MPFCSNCGARLNDGAKFCSECGESVGKSSDAYNAKNLNLTNGTDNKRHSLGEVAGAFASSIRSVADTAKPCARKWVTQLAPITPVPTMAIFRFTFVIVLHPFWLLFPTSRHLPDNKS